MLNIIKKPERSYIKRHFLARKLSIFFVLSTFSGTIKIAESIKDKEGDNVKICKYLQENYQSSNFY